MNIEARRAVSPLLRWSLGVCALALAVLSAAPALAALPGNEPWKTQVHGFFAQGLAKSWNNNFVGESTQGSGAYYEAGLSATAASGPLSVSAQGLLRRFGAADTAGPRLDFGFVDYRPVDTLDYSLGLRYGRVKNPYGLYNDSRDVVFTRPGILMPNSVYQDTASGGLRNLLFSSDGGQVYGGLALGDHYLRATVSRALDRTLTDEEVQSQFGASIGGTVDVKDLVVARLEDEWRAGTWRAAFSYLSATLDVDGFVRGSFDFRSWVGSLSHHARRYSIVAEYVFNEFKTAGMRTSDGDGFYVQGDYRLLPRWTLMGRYDAAFVDRNDRDGRSYAAATGMSRDRRYMHDVVIGARWAPDVHWGLWLEQHFMEGTAAVPVSANPDGVRGSDSQLLLLMVGYHF